jgi:hypothetical protein
MRRAPARADHNGVTSPPRLMLTAQITVTGEHIEGTVRAAGRPAQAFSGWSELFAVLLALTSQAGPDATTPGRPPAPAHHPDTAAQPPERRNHPGEKH